MKTAILAWGSLIWQPKELAYNKSFGWQKDGPILPIEFARISKDGRLTLVITENGTEVPVLNTLSNYHNLEEAILNLAVREGSVRNSTGSYDRIKDVFSSKFPIENEIKNWIKNTDFDAVIWTDLEENWSTKTNNRIEYLKELKGNTSVIAEEYIRKTPLQIQTYFRKEIEVTLNWTPILHE
jgi:hypothetical protein